MLKVPLLALACMAANPAHAIYKCTVPGGRVAFQELPCSGAGSEITVRPASGSAAPAAQGAASGGTAPMTEAERLNRASDQSARERHARELSNIYIPQAREELYAHRSECARRLDYMRANQYRYVQNFYGVVNRAAITSEMAAYSTECQTRERQLIERIDTLTDECKSVGCR
jgi:hypothetical protein